LIYVNVFLIVLLYGERKMKILSRAEELIMLSIWKLQKDAYCVPILQEAQKHTGKKWTLSGIYIPLGRLEKKGYLESNFGEPTPERGGKRKRFYRLTPAGFKALKEVKTIEKSMWKGLPETSLEDLL
jgi:PadR family transcriptional regulator PadR